LMRLIDRLIGQSIGHSILFAPDMNNTIGVEPVQ
jgi:hypothetical protein